MQILVLNCGSATVKYRLLAMPAATERARGVLRRTGRDDLAATLAAAVAPHSPAAVAAVGHRVVHGGTAFSQAVRVDAAVKAQIAAWAHLAPLHNPFALAGIEAAEALLPTAAHVAVFDTAFHATLPRAAWLYALPRDLTARYGIRRFGFHGISHSYVAERLAAHTGAAGRHIICHLGGGCSITAVVDGRSVDTSMGFTALEGLVMGTRCGDLDPGLPAFLQTAAGLDAQAVAELLYNQSGLRGLSGVSADLRDIEAALGRGDPGATDAFCVFTYRLRKYIGAFAAAMGGLDAVAFTGGIGENSWRVRAAALAALAFLGIELDPEQNRTARGEACITGPGSPVPVWVIPADEELVIARATLALLQ